MDKQEAIKILKEFHDTSALFSVRTALETVFPELKESEDERIRKGLIRFHKSTIDVDGIKGEDIIAWLEKQEGCEHIKKEWTTSDAATLKELIDFLENGTAKLQHDLTRYANWLKIQFTPIEKKSEQKSTWSEEDDYNVQCLVAKTNCDIQKGNVGRNKELIDWLKSLKNRIKNGGY